MPTEAVWIVVTVPKKDYEKEMKALKRKNLLNCMNNKDGIYDSIAKENDLEKYMEKILEESLEELGIEAVAWVPTRNGNYFHVYFPCDLYDNDSTLQYLQSKGIGNKCETSIGYIPFGLFYCDEFGEEGDQFDDDYSFRTLPGDGLTTTNKFDLSKKVNGFKEVTHNFLKSVTSRLTVAQVVDGVRSGAELTFDFICYTVFAGWIAAMGLINNSPVDIAAAMMIEPIMGTVMAITFGAIIEDRKLFNIGIKSNVVSLLICIVIGYVIGMIVLIWQTEWNPPPNGIWPTGEMQTRGTFRALIYGALLALPSGGAIAVTLLNNNQAALVGVAVASTFLPPFINTGLLWALATHCQIRGFVQQIVPLNISGHIVHLKPAWAPQEGYNVIYSYDMRIESSLLGVVSMALTFVNVICMLLFAYILLKIKEVVPLGKLSEGTHRFFHHDIKHARHHNRKSMGDDLGNQILKEWATIAGLDENELLSEKPEAKVTQLQTLFDIAQDVEADDTYQSIMRNALGNPDQNSLLRRLTQPSLSLSKRRSSAVPSPQLSFNNSINRDMENNISIPRAHTANTARRYTVSPVKEKTRRTSRLVSSNSENESQLTNTSQNLPVRGLRPEQIGSEDRRSSSVLLRKSLQSSVHSPYSVWPAAQRRSSSIYQNTGIRRRTSYAPQLDLHRESTDF